MKKEKKRLGFYTILFKQVCSLLFLFNLNIHFAQECPKLIAPLDGGIGIPTDVEIEWETTQGVPGYLLSLGTTPNGTDILNNQTVGSSNSYKPPTGLPENTRIYVSITLFFFNQPNITCEIQSFTTASLTSIPECTIIRRPLNQGLNINGATSITWDHASGATGYYLTLGTTVNGGEIINKENVGNVLQFKPTFDLPAETNLYLSVIPFNRIGNAQGCNTIIFSTSPASPLPTCTPLIYPKNGATNIPLSPTLEWSAVPGAKGYKVSIGSNPFNANILDNVTFTNNSTNVVEFEPNRTFFVTIIPFNDAGEAIGCGQETFSTLLGCGPFIEPETGEVIVLNPTPTLPDVVSICSEISSNTLTAPDEADGYRWYQRSPGGAETLISSSSEVTITSEGEYRYELFDNIEDSGNLIECSNSKVFTVQISESPIISTIEQTERGNGYDYTVVVYSNGNYEFAIDDINGPYQSSNRFTSIPPGTHTFYVKGINGCGITEKTIVQDLTVNGFPKFFTPNGDGTNDYWQFIPVDSQSEISISTIFIYNRYGNFITQIEPSSLGWDGMKNGRELPASDYWYIALSENNDEFKGHFTLKR